MKISKEPKEEKTRKQKEHEQEQEKKINVLQFTPYFFPHIGGVETIAEQRSKERVKQNKGKILNVTFSIEQIKKEYEKDGYQVVVLPAFEIAKNIPIPCIRKKDFRIAIKKINKFTANIYQTHTRFFLSSLVGGLLAKKNQTKRVHIEHGSGYVSGQKRRISGLSRIIDRTVGFFVFRQADHIIAIAEANKKFIKKFTKKEIKTIYNGIFFNPSKRKKTKNITIEDITIGYVGRLSALKNVSFLISSYKKIEQKYPNTKVHIIGDGTEKSELLTQTQKLGIKDKVSFLGKKTKEELETKYYNDIDIFVNPSLQEGLPTTVIEALISGCIVVATDVGGTKEITDKNNLILAETNNERSLFLAIEKAIVLSQKNKNRETKDSQEEVKKKFSINQSIKNYYDYYSLLCRDSVKMTLKL